MRRANSRGFTLIELMVVVVIIGIMAAVAVPQIVERMRERRSSQTAQEIALLYRNARLRAMGQGFSVLVNYTAAGGFRVLEAVPPGGAGTCTLLMPPSCTSVNWADAASYRVVTSYATQSMTGPDNVTQTVSDATTNSATTALDMCFTPRGRTYFRTAAAAPLVPMTDIVDVAVSRGANTLTRHVSVLPNGMSRLAL